MLRKQKERQQCNIRHNKIRHMHKSSTNKSDSKSSRGLRHKDEFCLINCVCRDHSWREAANMGYEFVFMRSKVILQNIH